MLSKSYPSSWEFTFNLFSIELNPVCHMLALLGAHHILHVSRIRVNLSHFQPSTRLHFQYTFYTYDSSFLNLTAGMLWLWNKLCYVMLCYVMLCYVMLCYVMLCYVIYLALILHNLGHSWSIIMSLLGTYWGMVKHQPGLNIYCDIKFTHCARITAHINYQKIVN